MISGKNGSHPKPKETMSESAVFPVHHLYKHEAMKTTFVLRICCSDVALANSLASECAQRIDELEQKLSRYHEGGDVFRINRMTAGQTLRVSEETHECLLTAMEAYVHTCGLFDPTLGAMIEHRKTGQDGTMPTAHGQLIVHQDTPAVTCETAGRIIDLGGIGKGFALDQIALLLDGWEIEGALFSAGASTHLAIGNASWPIDLISEHDKMRLLLQGEALSASGTTIQGSHIVHPAGGAQKISSGAPARIWARSASAAFSDAWSTALMLMNDAEISHAPDPAVRLSAVYLEKNGRLQTYSIDQNEDSF